MSNRSQFLRRFVPLFVAACGLAAAPAYGAQNPPVWVPLTTAQPPGAEAELVHLPAQSTQSRSVFELRIHGFWREAVVGADGLPYDRIRIPGMGEMGQVGAPELPALRTRIAVPTTAGAVQLLSATVPTGEQFTFSINVYPMPKPGSDRADDIGFGDTDGSDDQFSKDAAIYGANADWPAALATPNAPVQPFIATVPAAQVTLMPARSNPVLGRLRIARRTVYTYNHAGGLAALPQLNVETAKVAAASCVNWPTASTWITTNTVNYTGRYLIVTPAEYLDELEPFIAHRKSMGFAVATRTLESLAFVTCGEIRGAIHAWSQIGPPGADRFCLLVGDANVLPMCPSATPEQVPGDDLYGSPAGIGSLDESIYVGRLPADNSTELTRMLNKIRSYELDIDASHDYRRALLVAHDEGAPGKYVGAHEAVANAVYAVTPTFSKVYGNSPLSTDQGVLDAINDGRGLVAYRGHGSSKTWFDWNLWGENFTDVEVGTLTQSQRPVIWSFSCTNSAIDVGDGIGERWLSAQGGGVAHYGSTRSSGTTKNHTLDKQMFEAVYGLSVTTHGKAIAWAEAQMDAAHPDNGWQNAWMYHLLGCPAMRVRRTQAVGLGLTAPSSVPVTPTGQPFVVLVTNASGVPQPGVLVSAWKEAFDPAAGPDEFLVSVYTGTGGQATIPGPTTLGTINVTGRDDDGNVATVDVLSSAGAITKLGTGTPGTGGVKPRLNSSATMVAGAPVSIRVEDARPAAPGVFFLSLETAPLPLFGGTVHAWPAVVTQGFVSNFVGDWTFFVPALPAGIPAATEFYFQAAVIDPVAQDGIALTNALRAVTP